MFHNFKTVLRGFEIKFSTNVQKVVNVLPHDDIETKILKVAVIGMPNAGKSTFINTIMDRKVCPTSSKVHTTRVKSRAIFTDGDSQIVFVDTPGLVNLREQKRFNLEKSFIQDNKLYGVDLIGIIHDASNVWTRAKLDIKVIKLLEKHESKPSFLVLNKVDVVRSKRKLLDLTRTLTENCIAGKTTPGSKSFENDGKYGWPHFQDVFMISALTGSGLPEIRKYLIHNARPGQWMFPAEIWSDQTAEGIVSSSVKAKLLDFLPQEIPYQLKPEMEFFNINEKGVISTVVLVHCPTQRIAKLVAGVGDGKLRQITESLQRDLQETFQNYVRIKLVLHAPTEE